MKLSRVFLVLVMLAAVALGADYGSKYYGERVAEDEVSARLHTGQAPEVSLEGFPFLWHVYEQEVPHAEIIANDFSVDTEFGPIQIDRIQFKIDDLGWTDQHALIGKADGVVRLSWEELSNQFGATVGPYGDRGIAVQKTVEIAGREVGVVVGAELIVNGADHTLSIDSGQVKVSTGGFSVPVPLARQILSQLPSVGLPQVQGMDLSLLRANPEGLHLDVHGKNLKFER